VPSGFEHNNGAHKTNPRNSLNICNSRLSEESAMTDIQKQTEGRRIKKIATKFISFLK